MYVKKRSGGKTCVTPSFLHWTGKAAGCIYLITVRLSSPDDTTSLKPHILRFNMTTAITPAHVFAIDATNFTVDSSWPVSQPAALVVELSTSTMVVNPFDGNTAHLPAPLFPGAPRAFDPSDDPPNDPGRVIALTMSDPTTPSALPTHHFASHWMRQNNAVGAAGYPRPYNVLPSGPYLPDVITTGPFVFALMPQGGSVSSQAAMRVRAVYESDADAEMLDADDGVTVKYTGVSDGAGGVSFNANAGRPWTVASATPMALQLVSTAPSSVTHSTRRLSIVRGVTSILYRGDSAAVDTKPSGEYGASRTYIYVRDSAVCNPPIPANPSSPYPLHAGTMDALSPTAAASVNADAINDFLGLKRFVSEGCVFFAFQIPNYTPAPNNWYLATTTDGIPAIITENTVIDPTACVRVGLIDGVPDTTFDATGATKLVITWTSALDAVYNISSPTPQFEIISDPSIPSPHYSLYVAPASAKVPGKTLSQWIDASIAVIDIRPKIEVSHASISIAVRHRSNSIVRNVNAPKSVALVVKPPPSVFSLGAHIAGKDAVATVVSVPIGIPGGPINVGEAAGVDDLVEYHGGSTEYAPATLFRTTSFVLPVGTATTGRVTFWNPIVRNGGEAIVGATIALPYGYDVLESGLLTAGSQYVFTVRAPGYIPHGNEFVTTSDADVVEAVGVLNAFAVPSSPPELAQRILMYRPGDGFEGWTRDAYHIARNIQIAMRGNPAVVPNVDISSVTATPLETVVSNAVNRLWLGLRIALVSGVSPLYSTQNVYIAASPTASLVGQSFGNLVRTTFGGLRYDTKSSSSPFGGLVLPAEHESTRWAIVTNAAGQVMFTAPDVSNLNNIFRTTIGGTTAAYVVPLAALAEPTTNDDFRLTTGLSLQRGVFGSRAVVLGRLLYVASVVFEYAGTTRYSIFGSNGSTVISGTIREAVAALALSPTIPIAAINTHPATGEPYPLLQVLAEVAAPKALTLPPAPDGVVRCYPSARGYDPWLGSISTRAIGFRTGALEYGEHAAAAAGFSYARRFIEQLSRATPPLANIATLKNLGFCTQIGGPASPVIVARAATLRSFLTVPNARYAIEAATVAYQAGISHSTLNSIPHIHNPVGAMPAAFAVGGVVNHYIASGGWSGAPLIPALQYALRAMPLVRAVAIAETLGSDFWRASTTTLFEDAAAIAKVVLTASTSNPPTIEDLDTFVSDATIGIGNDNSNRLTTRSKAIFRVVAIIAHHVIMGCGGTPPPGDSCFPTLLSMLADPNESVDPAYWRYDITPFGIQDRLSGP